LVPPVTDFLWDCQVRLIAELHKTAEVFIKTLVLSENASVVIALGQLLLLLLSRELTKCLLKVFSAFLRWLTEGKSAMKYTSQKFSHFSA